VVPAPPVAIPAAAAWDTFWRSRGVSPAPPPDFMDVPPQPVPEVINQTAGALDDDTARRWVAADLRRGRADGWASNHLRLDVANAGVFGPAGLNGTARGIEGSLAAGAVEIRCAFPSEVVAAAVVAVPRDLQALTPRWVGLTDFVIVLKIRAGDRRCERILRDGRHEPVRSLRVVGELSWQLDTGQFRDDPVVGQLWYQVRGWSCRPDQETITGRLCGVVEGRPLPGTITAERGP
jgi:hypothetical protein